MRSGKLGYWVNERSGVLLSSDVPKEDSFTQGLGNFAFFFLVALQ